VLPDGCLDLLFDGRRLLVAGPDTAARVHHTLVAELMWGVRLHDGLGPELLGVPADELRDTTVPLEQVWSERRVRRLGEQVAADPANALAAWTRSAEPPTFGTRLVALLRDGGSVAAAADNLGYSTRQLQRRTLPVFGYGPQHLRRVLRLGRVLEQADRGVAWALVAQRAGFADQAHLARDVRTLTGASPSALRRERVRSVQDIG
jgi:AraC-like DNA-binding protein